jgi:hypothetical protein
MAAPLAGMTGLYGPPELPHGQTGRDPTNWGTPPDRRHAIPGDSSGERPYGGTSYGQAPELPAAAPSGAAAPTGEQGDRTPTVHSAPYPRGIAHDPLIVAEQMRELHGLDLGGPSVLEDAGTPYPVHLESGRYASPNQSVLAAAPNQLRNGNDDVDQGDGSEQGWGFAHGYQFRRWFQDPVPLDRTNLNGGERPFRGRHLVWQSRFDGPDSPYGAAGDTSVDMMQGPTPVGYATPYQQAPNPTMAAAQTAPAVEGAAIDDGWVAG